MAVLGAGSISTTVSPAAPRGDALRYTTGHQGVLFELLGPFVFLQAVRDVMSPASGDDPRGAVSVMTAGP